jgi:Voltage gated chloride channel
VIANLGPAKDLPHIWPTTGLTGFEMDGPGKALIVGFTKLIAISFTVAGGLRGGECNLDATCTTSATFHAAVLILCHCSSNHHNVVEGYIFPLMCSGAAFGRLLYYIFPDSVPMQLAVLCTAAGMNVAITRTSLATTLILAFLAGEPAAIPPTLMASLCSLFATSYVVRIL